MPSVYYNEHDKKKCAALKSLMEDGHISKGEIDDRPIQEVKADDVRGYTRCHWFAGFGGWDVALELAGWHPDRPVWTASCPCQDYSNAGPKTAQQGQRHLWPYFARLAAECRPPEIFGEQVDDAIAAGWLDDAFSDLEAQDYACATAVLPAVCVGLAHERYRDFFVAHANGLRLPGSWKCYPPLHKEALSHRETDQLVHAVRWNTLPFLCRRHDGVRRKVCEVANHGFGDAIIPELTAWFLQSYMGA